jgi:hypothetical protein
MIHNRRQLHRNIFSVLLLVIPLMLVLSLVFRPQVPPVVEFDAELQQQAGLVKTAPLSTVDAVADSNQFDLRIHKQQDDIVTAVTIQPRSFLLKPDLLVYWSRHKAIDNSLPASAHLVGRLTGISARELQLPPDAADLSGNLMIYSLAHYEVVTSISLESASVVQNKE